MPYVRGFLDEPREARLKISIEDDAVLAVLELAEVDKRKFDRNSHLRSEQRRAFNNLVRANVKNREPVLLFESR